MASRFKASSILRNWVLKKNQSLVFCTRPRPLYHPRYFSKPAHSTAIKPFSLFSRSPLYDPRYFSKPELLNPFMRRRNYHKGATAGNEKVIDCHNKLDYYRLIDDSIESKKLVVVYFMQPWCKVCLSFAPKLPQIVKNRTDLILIKIFAFEFKALSREYAVEDVPMFVFLKDGKEVDRIIGAKMEELEMKLDHHCAAAAP